MTVPVSAKRTALLAAARERILVLDGAMGTMIQGLRIRRGRVPRRALQGFPSRSPRQQRPADPDPAEGDRGHPRRLSARRRRHRRHQHLLLDLDRAGRLRHVGPRLRAEPRRREARARRRRRASAPRTASRASSPARSARPTAPPRSRPTSPIPATAPSPSTICARPMASRSTACSTAAPTCCWSRPSSTR